MKIVLALVVSITLSSCITVTQSQTSGFLPRHGHAAVTSGARIVVMAGSNGMNPWTEFRYDFLVRDFVASSDGISWTPVMPQGFFYGVGAEALTDSGAMVASGGAFSPPGDNSGVPTFDSLVYRSSDGGSGWQGRAGMPDGLNHFGFVSFQGKYWILGGNKGVGDLSLPYSASNMQLSNAIYSLGSSDTTWTQVLPNAADPSRWSPRDGHAVVVFQNKLWVFGGRATVEDPSTGNTELRSLGDAWSSADGVHWTFEAQSGDSTRWEALGRAFHQVVALNGALFLIGGIDQSPKYRFDAPAAHNDIQRSLNGRTWETVATFPGARFDHTATVMGNSFYILGGRDASQVFSDVVKCTP
jgi:hypothetical protein